MYRLISAPFKKPDRVKAEFKALFSKNKPEKQNKKKKNKITGKPEKSVAEQLISSAGDTLFLFGKIGMNTGKDMYREVFMAEFQNDT